MGEGGKKDKNSEALEGMYKEEQAQGCTSRMQEQNRKSQRSPINDADP